MIRPWTTPIAPLRDALHGAGLDVTLVRVDIEPALNAALMRSNFDVIVLDRATPGITCEVVETCLRARNRWIPIVELITLETVADEIRHALATSLN